MSAHLKRKSVHVHVVPLVAAKAALVLIAVLVQEALKNSMDNPALVVAIGLGLAVALLGPLGDRRFFTPITRPSSPTVMETAR